MSSLAAKLLAITIETTGLGGPSAIDTLYQPEGHSQAYACGTIEAAQTIHDEFIVSMRGTKAQMCSGRSDSAACLDSLPKFSVHAPQIYNGIPDGRGGFKQAVCVQVSPVGTAANDPSGNELLRRRQFLRPNGS